MNQRLSDLTNNIASINKTKQKFKPQEFLLTKEMVDMAAADQKKLDVLNKEIEGLQNAIRRLTESYNDALGMVALLRDESDEHKHRLHQLEMRVEKKPGTQMSSTGINVR